MKKGSVLLVVLLAGLLFAACSRSNAGQHFGEAIQGWRPSDASARSRAPAEIVVYDSPEFGDTLGFTVTRYPDTAALSPTKFFVIDEWFAQIEYRTEDDRVLVVRVAADDSRSLATTYTKAYTTGDDEVTIDGIEVRVRNADDGDVLVTWQRDGYQYALHSVAGQAALSEEEIETFVTGLDSAPAG